MVYEELRYYVPVSHIVAQLIDGFKEEGYIQATFLPPTTYINNFLIDNEKCTPFSFACCHL